MVRAIVVVLLMLALPSVSLAPATADGNDLETRTVLRITRNTAVFGQRFAAIGQVQGYGTKGWGYLPETTGTVYLERRLAGQSDFHVIDSRTSGDGRVSFPRLSAVRNGLYRLRYSGGDYSADGNTQHFSPTTGAAVLLRVRRQLNDRALVSHRRLYIRGNVNPGWGHRYLRIQRKTCARCPWHRNRLVRTNAYGGFLVRVEPPRRGTWRYRLVLRGTLPFSTTISGVYLAHHS